MAYICENCGELVEDNKVCSCLIEDKKELLKNRKKKYFIRKKIDSDIKNSILKGRDISEDFSEFINVDFDELKKDKFLNQEEAVEIIYKNIIEKKKIGIYGDYDADGITGAAVGYNIIKALGGNVTYYINDRFKEGFGICSIGVNKLKKENVDLIITVDNGIAGVEGVEKAKELGMEVIVTDHHEPNEMLPDTLIVDPKQIGCNSKNKDITGVGVLFKVLLDVCMKFNKEIIAKKEMDLVALGTIADMAPLIGENRLIVKTGLMIWNLKKGKYGVKRLVEKLGFEKEIKAYELGFIIAPILNAESRLLGRPEKGINILISDNKEEIDRNIDFLIKNNNKRKDMLEKQLVIGDSLIDPNKYFFFIHNEGIDEGIAGLIASRLLEKYRRPTIVLGKTNEGYYKGSGRSSSDFNLKKALDKNSKFLINYGGHNMACGLTVNENNLEIVKSFLETEGKLVLEGKEVEEEIIIDLEISIDDINEDIINEINSLEPFGLGFKKPIFLIRDVNIENINILKEVHTKFNYKGIDFLAFNKILDEGKFNVIGFPQINQFKGIKRNQFLVKEVILEDESICELEK